VLAIEGSPESLAMAARDLSRLREQAMTINSTRYLCELFALGALILRGQGEERDAFEALRQALALGETRGLIRVFVDLGPEMSRLLTLFVARHGPTEYRRQLLAAFAADVSVLGQIGSPAAVRLSGGEAARAIDPLVDELIEPLSRRELDVLFLLSQRLTDKEIARELSISPQTVKRHAANVYQKLDVGNRRDAVAKAAALGLLSGLSDSARVPR
jgi:LuxR family maltose regulon positive regulatory protein